MEGAISFVPGSAEAQQVPARDPVVEADVTVVGAGPAGLTAASVLVESGLTVALFDDNLQPGGQYFKQLPHAFSDPSGRFQSEPRRARALIGVTSHPQVRFFPGTTIWARPEAGVLAFSGVGGSGRVRSRAVVIAAGAHDRAVPFPGWTLPGVITAGAALNLIKGQRLLPGRRILVAGTGPLLLVTAHALIEAGAEVVAVAEAGRPDRAALSNAARLLWAPGLLARGLKYRWTMLHGKTAYLPGHSVIEAIGTSAVVSARIAPISPDGIVDRGRARDLDVDAVVAGFGLSPSIELTRMIGCAHRFDARLGGWIPVRSKTLETSESGVYAVGDAAAIGGVEIAVAEASLAADAIIRRHKGEATPAGAATIRKAARRLGRLYRFRAGLNLTFRGPEVFVDLLTPETLICRCEDVTAAALVRSLRENDNDLGQVKYATRISMGRCQGRNCLRSLSDLTGRPESGEPAPFPAMRPPARPIRIATLLNEPLAEARSPDMTLP